MSFGEYSFLPWLRRGIANQLETPAAAASRASLAVSVRVRSDAATLDVPPKPVLLVGPGDVIGVNAAMVIRTEPLPGITNFEPNYLAYVDFYDEDFAWRYTPDKADLTRHRLVPWITLLVLKEDEFKPLNRHPLPAIELTPAANVAATLPPENELWAWAHVHINASLGSGIAPNLDVLGALLKQSPDVGYCRLMSPRRLQPNTRYFGFVVPTFEVGRLAGLGLAVPDNASGLTIAWTTARSFPVYYQWWFSTGAAGDFEELVTALVPRDIPADVGIRKMDVQQPGFHVPATTGQPDDVVGLEGVLLAPTTKPIPVAEACDLPAHLAAQVNLPADVQDAGIAAGEEEEDPLISVPLYGRWHALVERVRPFAEHRNWINELNTDPRFRAVAGMGTKVIQQNQESYMKLAWDQIGDVLSMNRKISLLRLSVKASDALYAKSLTNLPPEHVLAVAAPVMTKVFGSPVTIHTLVHRSRLPRAALSGAMRKQLRPRGQLARRTFGGTAAVQPLRETIAGLNAGTLTAAPPRPAPAGATYESSLNAIDPHTPEWLRWLASHRQLVLIVALILLLLLFALASSPAIQVLAVVAAVGAGVAYRRLTSLATTVSTVSGFQLSALTPDAIQSLPPNDAFVLPPPDAPIQPMPPAGGADSAQGAAFRQAAMEFNAALSDRPAPAAPLLPLAIDSAHASLMRALRPAPAFVGRYAMTMSVGAQPFSRYVDAYHDLVATIPALGEEPRVAPVMAYPDIKLPMYRPLKEVQKDDFVPNLHLVPPDTISLMLTNPPVIESYMLGLNHEFARELLWREYPTDQRPSTFRQFWDPSSFVDTEGLTAEAMAEKVRDIRKIHEWPLESTLGKHNNRLPNDDKPRVVLIIRGELLKRYPNTIVYAQRARWGDPPDHQNHLSLYDETGEKAVKNPKDPNFTFPMFRAQVEPDIYFIGFDLLLEDVRGDPTLDETAEARARIDSNRLGWFFVLQEVVGEPRFGLDEHAVTDAEDPLKWDNLSWENLGASVAMIKLATPFASNPPGIDSGGATWGSHSADMAFILYQKPVLVGVHSRDMLKNLLNT
jgi:hypothetical protein